MTKTATRTAKSTRALSLTEQVCEALRTDILTCRLRPGEDLNEAQIADRFGISKTPAREALAQLRQEGLVRSFQRRGYQVAPVTLADMDQIFEVRMVLEAGAAERACLRVTPEKIERLRLLASDEPRLGEGPLGDRFRRNREFHLAIAEAAGNARLTEHLSRQLYALERIFYLGAQLGQTGQDTRVTHAEIVEAIARRDPVAARAVVTRHNEETRQGLFQSLAAGLGLEMLAL